MSETKEMITKQKKKPVWLLAIIIVAIAVVVGIIVFMSAFGGGRKYSKQMQLAQHYLSEMDYEQAIAAFEQAININPKQADAYLGLADVYLAMADEVMEEINETVAESQGEAMQLLTDSQREEFQNFYQKVQDVLDYYQKALDVLEDALENLEEDDEEGRELIQRKIEEIQKLLNALLEADSSSAVFEDQPAEEIELEPGVNPEDGYPEIDKLIADSVPIVNASFDFKHSMRQNLTRSYRKELVTPIIDELEDYIVWMDSVKGVEAYQELFINGILFMETGYDPDIIYSGMPYVMIDEKNYLAYEDAYLCLIIMYEFMDDLEGAYEVKRRMQEAMPDIDIPMEEFEVGQDMGDGTWQNVQFDKYDRTIRIYWYTEGEDSAYEIDFEYNDLNQIIRRTEIDDAGVEEVQEFKYDEEGRLIEYSFRIGTDKSIFHYSYPVFGTVICPDNDPGEYHYNEYGQKID